MFKTSAPGHLVTTSPVWGELKRDEEWVCRSGLLLASVRGERNRSEITRLSDAEGDGMLMEVHKFLNEHGAKYLIETNPELADAIHCNRVTDIHTKTYAVDLRSQRSGVIDVGDLSFNLTPRRSKFIKHLKEYINEKVFTDLCEFLDRPCSKGYGCAYFTTFFPHVGQPAPVAMSPETEFIITHTLAACSGQPQIDTIATMVRDIIKIVTKNCMAIDTCIVCILLSSAGRQHIYNGTRINDEDNPKTVFLINTSQNSGFITVTSPDHFKDTVNVHGCKCVQLLENLSFSDDYTLYRDNFGEWDVVRTYNQQITVHKDG